MTPGHMGPNVVVECTPLPLKARARQFRNGLDVWTPAQRRIPPDMLSPRAKTHNYLNMIVAEQSVKAHDPEGWAVLLDVNGNLAEGSAPISLWSGRRSCIPRANATCSPVSAAR